MGTAISSSSLLPPRRSCSTIELKSGCCTSNDMRRCVVISCAARGGSSVVRNTNIDNIHVGMLTYKNGNFHPCETPTAALIVCPNILPVCVCTCVCVCVCVFI